MPPSPSPSYHWLDPSQLCHHKICKLALLLISLFLFLIRPVYLTRMLMLHFFSTTDALVIVKRNATLISRPCILFWLHKAKIQETLNVAAPPSRMIFLTNTMLAAGGGGQCWYPWIYQDFQPMNRLPASTKMTRRGILSITEVGGWVVLFLLSILASFATATYEMY